jgi:23S rRNA pseudouridine1911/1915/1917 synthase
MQLPKNASKALQQALRDFHRQALHAIKLTLTHPENGKELTFSAPLPCDMQGLIQVLRDDLHHNEKTNHA